MIDESVSFFLIRLFLSPKIPYIVSIICRGVPCLSSVVDTLPSLSPLTPLT